MLVTVIALVGSLLDPQIPASAPLTGSGGWTNLALPSDTLAATGAMAITVSRQDLSAITSGISIRSGDGSGTLRTGDIVMDSGSSHAFSGVQATSFNTGFGSNVQSAVSIAAGSVIFGKLP